MINLKTLKDLEKEFSNDSDIKLINTMFLKQEAIKWWKSINFDEKRRSHVEIDDKEAKSVLGWIEVFFNLSKEDLNGS